MTNTLESRQRRYYNLSTQLAFMDSAQLQAPIDPDGVSYGWGRNHVLDIGESKVFVKRIAITDLELENLFSTRNLYDLPTYYNYGVGSAGFGVSRELVSHIKTTN